MADAQAEGKIAVKTGQLVRKALYLLVLMAATAVCCAEEPAGGLVDPKPIAYGQAKLVAKLANAAVKESSGIAASRKNEGVFWTHNDSGGGPWLFAFNAKGDDLGAFEVAGAGAVDWEDIASFEAGGKGWLLIGDVGDNAAQRKTYALYIVEEPLLRAGRKPGRLRVEQKIEFRYEDGPHNCESVGIDAKERTIYLVSKTVLPRCKVYALPVPKAGETGVAVAKAIATLSLPTTTAMDIAADGSRAVVLTYGPAYEFPRKDGEAWKDAFSRKPHTIEPGVQRAQGEAVCYGLDNRTLYLTSEGSPCPVWEVPPSSAATK